MTPFGVIPVIAVLVVEAQNQSALVHKIQRQHFQDMKINRPTLQHQQLAGEAEVLSMVRVVRLITVVLRVI